MTFDGPNLVSYELRKSINNFNQSVYISWLKKIYHFFSSHINIALNYYYFFPSSWQLVLYHCLLLILFEMWEQICAKNDTPKQLGLHHVGWTNGASAMYNDTPNSIKFCTFNDSQLFRLLFLFIHFLHLYFHIHFYILNVDFFLFCFLKCVHFSTNCGYVYEMIDMKECDRIFSLTFMIYFHFS